MLKKVTIFIGRPTVTEEAKREKREERLPEGLSFVHNGMASPLVPNCKRRGEELRINSSPLEGAVEVLFSRRAMRETTVRGQKNF